MDVLSLKSKSFARSSWEKRELKGVKENTNPSRLSTQFPQGLHQYLMPGGNARTRRQRHTFSSRNFDMFVNKSVEPHLLFQPRCIAVLNCSAARRPVEFGNKTCRPPPTVHIAHG